jgi:O-antigen/teichoic acid export membrane protein
MDKVPHDRGGREPNQRAGRKPGGFVGRVLTYFGASVVQGLLSLAILPLTTVMLGPAEFGAFGIVAAAVTLAGSLADMGFGIVLSGHYLDQAGKARKQLIATLLAWAALSGLAAGVAMFILWPAISNLAGSVSAISEMELALACLSVPLRSVISLGTQVLVIQFRAIDSGVVVTLQAVALFVSTLAALFVFDQGQSALFIGYAAGVGIGCAATIILLREDFAAMPAWRWSAEVFRAAPSGMLAGILENLRTFVESIVMVRALGVSGLGVFNHSRLYQGYLGQVANAIAYALWPAALEEARIPGDGFEKVGRAWNTVYLGLTVAGVALAALGIEIVSILTNGKFVDAAPWVPLWVAYLLLQNSGKPATATLYAARRGAAVARYRAASLSLALVALVTLVPAYGIPAAIGIAFGEMLVFRLLLRRGALAIRRLPFQDGWVIAGCCIIALLTAMIHGLSLALPVRGTIFLLATAALLVAGWGTVLDAFRHVRQFLASRAPRGKS